MASQMVHISTLFNTILQSGGFIHPQHTWTSTVGAQSQLMNKLTHLF